MLTVRVAIWTSFWTLIVFFCLFLAADYLESAPILVECPKPNSHSREKANANQCTEYRSTYFIGTPPIIVTIAAIADRHEGAVVGFATVILAAATGLLATLSRKPLTDSRALQRAFIAIEPGGIRPFEGDDKRIACDVIIINAGNMPARNVRWTIYKGYSRSGARKKFPIRASTMVEHGIVLAPKARARKGSRATNRQRFATIRNDAQSDRAWMYIWGRIIYHDGFRDGRVIEFCHRYNLHGASGFTIPKKNGRHHEYGNKADED